jgi:hypothetical protein
MVTMDLPTLGTNPNSIQHGSTTQNEKDLGNSAMHQADRPRGLGGLSAGLRRTIRK